MVQGSPNEARWLKAEPRRGLSPALLERMVHTAFPRCTVLAVQPLGGKRNANFKLRIDCEPEFIVLRIYEHDASLCQKELDLFRLIGDSVPVPQVVHAEPGGWEDVPPFTLSRYIEGITYRELARSGDEKGIAEVSFSAGEVLARVGRTSFPKPGWLAPGPTVAAPLLQGANSVPRFVDACLASLNLQRRMAVEARERTSRLVWKWAPEVADLEGESCLVHGDFGKQNLLVRKSAGRWIAAAILDWEFAFSGSPLADVGHFLRYERASRPVAEPHFSEGYARAGGKLPKNWRQLARLLDLTALCESLTHDELPADVEAELVELVRASVEGREPQFA
jgi:fructokinase